MIRPVSLQLALSAICDGSEIVKSGRTEDGLRLIGYAAEYLEGLLADTDAGVTTINGGSPGGVPIRPSQLGIGVA